MKILNTLKKISIIILVFSLILSCSKDRIEVEKNDYSSMNDYLDSKKEKEQVFEIGPNGNCPIIGKHGTKICGAKNALQLPNGDTVSWNYTVKLIELYSVKDMIYYQHSNINETGLLSTEAEIRIRNWKENSELSLRPGMTWNIEMPNDKPQNEMEMYLADGSTESVNWSSTSSGLFPTSTYGYLNDINSLGWVAPAKKSSVSTSTVTYSFTSSTDVLDNVLTYIYFPNQKSLLKISNQTATNIPIEEDMKIILMGITSSGKLFHYYSETTSSTNNTTIDLSLTEISDDDLTNILDEL